jgi:hypothetical protein
MTAAVQSRNIIGQAKGMLMERWSEKVCAGSNTSLRTVASHWCLREPTINTA